MVEAESSSDTTATETIYVLKRNSHCLVSHYRSFWELIVSSLLIIIMINYLAGIRQRKLIVQVTTADLKTTAIFSRVPRCKTPLKPRVSEARKYFKIFSCSFVFHFCLFPLFNRLERLQWKRTSAQGTH